MGGCLGATLFTPVSSLATQPNPSTRRVESLLPPTALYAAGTGVAKLPAMLERSSLGNVVAVPASEDGSTEPFATPLTEHASRLPVAPPIPRGERVGPWTIERELGRGGMGVVYEGRKADGARAAIKLAVRTLSAESRERFLREGRAAARLDHPSIVRVLETGESERGPWIALELVAGTSLATLLAEGEVPVPRALEIVERVARAMDHAHRRGIVHRDLKPGNVLVAKDGSVKVTDFGLAKDLEAEPVTAHGVPMGTPSFMSPEQIEGKSEAVRAAADVYAIGTLLYVLATRTRPFEGPRSVADAAALVSAPEPPSRRRPDRALPAGLDAVAARALDPRPERRYATALELAEDVALIRRGGAPTKTEPGPHFALVPGDRIGPHELLYPVGRGGAAVVFKARGPEGVVAVKVLNDPTGALRARFEREVRLLGALSREEGFVPLLGHGLSKHGPWLAMPFLTGGTLRDRFERGPLAVAEAVAIVATAARAVGRAHARGIVHRDLKPENIIFSSSGAPLVADLGLARHFSRDLPGGSESVSVTRDTRFLGTTTYVPPEQLSDPRTAGPAADVFALGCILHEALAGEPAFCAPSYVALVMKVARGACEPLRQIRPEVPASVVDTVLRALRVDPATRFPDASSFARALGSEEV